MYPSTDGGGTWSAWNEAITAIAPVISVNGSTGAVSGLATLTGTENIDK